MLKRAIFAGAALVIGATYMQIAVTPALAGQNIKPRISKPKPRIRVVRPKVRIKINPNRLARRKQEKKKKDTTPVLAQPRGTPAGYDTANRPGGDIPGTGSIDAPITPKLDVSDGIREFFEVTGGNVNHARNINDLDALRGSSAMRDAFGAAAGGIPDSNLVGSDMVRQRVGAVFGIGNDQDGPPRGGGGFVNPGHSMGWHEGSVGRVRGRTVSSRYYNNHENGTDTYHVERDLGTGRTTTTLRTRGPGGSVTTVVTVVQPTTDDGRRAHTTTTTSSENNVRRTRHGTLRTNRLPASDIDQDGNGIPDDVDRQREADAAAEAAAAAAAAAAAERRRESAGGGGSAGGGDQGGDYIDPDYSTPRGTIWTPLGGLVVYGVSPLDKTSQPPPTDVQGTVMVSDGSSKPTLGPEAVTNPGGGDNIAGEGRGGGGSMIDPCATVAGCDGDPDGDGPVPGAAGLEDRPASN